VLSEPARSSIEIGCSKGNPHASPACCAEMVSAAATRARCSMPAVCSAEPQNTRSLSNARIARCRTLRRMSVVQPCSTSSSEQSVGLTTERVEGPASAGHK